MRIMRQLSVSAAGAVIVCLATSNVAQAVNLVTNGSFETPILSPAKFTNRSTGTTFGNWTVGSGNIDHIGTYWQAANGVQSLELNGGASGRIFQDLTTQPGKGYKLSFALAGNTDNLPTEKTAQATFGGFTINPVTFNTTGRSRSNMGWQNLTFLIPGSDITGTTTRLEFASLTPGGFGPAIDNVSVEAVPFEFSPGLGFLILGAWGAVTQIKRQGKIANR